MRFDWYQATIPETPEALIDGLFESLGGDEVKHARGKHNYHHSTTILDGAGDRIALVLHGGPNGHPNVTASGEKTPSFVQAVRGKWAEHYVTRFDAAEDFDGEGAYERLHGVCREVAEDSRIKGRAIIPDDLREGRSYYLGAASSDVRVRLYDKAAEMRRHIEPGRHHLIPDNLTRLEVQVRPRNEWRRFASQMTPETIWGFSPWSSKLAQGALGLALERIEMRARKETTHDRAYRFMVTQYRNVLMRQLEDLGSWSAVGMQLGLDLERFEEESKNLKTRTKGTADG